VLAPLPVGGIEIQKLVKIGYDVPSAKSTNHRSRLFIIFQHSTHHVFLHLPPAMIDLSKKENCCGCSACVSVCPISCISWQTDHEGFDYPHVDQTKCTQCKKCVNVCPVLHPRSPGKPTAYACYNTDEEIRGKSSSGGIFTMLAELVLSKNGIVFGARFDDHFRVVHDSINTAKSLDCLRGSKYVQSHLEDSFPRIKRFLDEGREVLFSGTPCQVAGLRNFLGRGFSNLLVVDLVCHGVPSPKVLRLYREELENKHHSNVREIRFRDKACGWKNFQIVMEFDQYVYRGGIWKDPYMRGFLVNLFLRPSCHCCKANAYRSGSDITLGDYWGIETIHPHLDDDRGISLLLTHTAKGEEYFGMIQGQGLRVETTKLAIAIPHNPCLVRSVRPHGNRKRFFKEFEERPLSEWIQECTKSKRGVIPLCKRIVKRLLCWR